jgi:GH15 family glucan-1,4-alpha-glucosidase
MGSTSLLLMPLVRFLPPDDPRIRATVLAIADELTQEELVLLYRVNETDDGLSGEEGTFVSRFHDVGRVIQDGATHGACDRVAAHQAQYRTAVAPS